MTKGGRIGCGLVVLFATLWVLTGGLVHRSNASLSPSVVGLTFFLKPSSEDSWPCGLDLRVGLKQTWHRQTGIPALFVFKHVGAPFTLEASVALNCVSVSISPFKAIEITKIVAEYDDGEVIREDNSWYVEPGPRERNGYSYHASFEKNLLTLPRHADVKIILEGNLFKADAEKATFDEIGTKALHQSHFRLIKVERGDTTFRVSIPLRSVLQSDITTAWAELLPG